MAHPQLTPVLKALAMGRSRFLYGLDRTPEDRLAWSPGGSAYTPLQLAARLALFLRASGEVIRTGAMPGRPSELPPPPASRAEAKEHLGAAFDQLSAVIAGLSEADFDRKVATPWGEPVPVRQMLGYLPGIVNYVQGQLNYLQLIYGDTDANIPPGWGKEEI